jgi:hypothetical protein
VLFLRPGTREHFMETLQRDWPALVPRYKRLYDAAAYLPKAVTEPIKKQISAFRDEFEIADRRAVKLEPEPEPEQLGLSI